MDDAFRARVLRAISDDYEELPTIASEVEPRGAADAVLEALRELVGVGLARAFRYDAAQQKFVDVEFDETCAEGLWFYATAAGRRQVASLNRAS
jgi:hypothetical protein